MYTIIGAGMAGLLAGNMLRSKNAQVIEAAEEIPNNHSSVLRFRTSIVGDALDIPFSKVKMVKSVHPWRNPVADNLAYSRKCTGIATLRSIITADGDLVDRYIAPGNLIGIMADQLSGRTTLNKSFDIDDIKDHSGPIISTIPMPTLMTILKYEKPNEFIQVNGSTINCFLDNVFAFASVYVPDPEFPFSRVSLTGNKLTIELPSPGAAMMEIYEFVNTLKEHERFRLRIIFQALFCLGIDENSINSDISINVQKYAKILPIDEEERRRFIVWASNNHDVYSLGRFATWRPGLLLDDLVNDIRVIRKLIDGGSDYDHRKKNF